MMPQAGFPVGTFPDGFGSGDSPISDEIIIAAATSAQSVTIDGQSYTERSIDDLIKASNYIKSRQLKGNGWGAIGRAKAIPPSASGRDCE
jgi:hypothetical protein